MAQVLDHHFAADKSLVPVLGPTAAIVRATIGTHFDAAGDLLTAAAAAARFEHDPASANQSLGLLVEEPRSNVHIRSAEVDNAAWFKLRATAVANQASAPDGTMAADELVEDGTASNSHFVRTPTITYDGSSPYTYSVFLEPNTRDEARLDFPNAAFPASATGFVDLGAGTIGTLGAGMDSGKIQDVGGGRFKVSMTATSDASVASFNNVILAVSPENISYNGDSVSSIYVWGGDLQVGAFPLSHIPTTTAAVARNADVVTLSDVSWMGVENSLYVKFRTGYIGQDTTVLSLHDGTANERIALEITGGNIHFIGVDGGVTQWDISTAVAADTEYQIAVAFGAGDIAFYMDGVQIGLDASATIPTVTTLNFGSDHADLEFLNSTMARVVDYDERLDNDALQAASNGNLPSEGFDITGFMRHRRGR